MLLFLPLFFIPIAYCFYKAIFAIGCKNAYVAAGLVVLLTEHVVVQNVHFARAGIDLDSVMQKSLN